MRNPHSEWLDKLIASTDREAAFAALGPLFLAATDAERIEVYNGWDFGVHWPYPTPSRLGCSKGERSPPRDRIISSLVLDSLVGAFGTREHLIALSETYRSCELAGLSPAQVFESVAGVLPIAHAEILISFLRRTPEQRAPSAFGLVETVNADGEVEIHLRM